MAISQARAKKIVDQLYYRAVAAGDPSSNWSQAKRDRIVTQLLKEQTSEAILYRNVETRMGRSIRETTSTTAPAPRASTPTPAPSTGSSPAPSTPAPSTPAPDFRQDPRYQSTYGAVQEIWRQALSAGDDPTNWDEAKIQRIVQQILQGDRTVASVRQDVSNRLGRPLPGPGEGGYGPSPAPGQPPAPPVAPAPGAPAPTPTTPPPVTTPPGTPPTSPTTPAPQLPDGSELVREQQRSSARAMIITALREYGIETESMVRWVYEQVALDRTSDEIMLELRQRPEYASRFPGMERRRAAGGLNPISERDYINFENGVRQWAAQNGVPDDWDFLSADGIADLVAWDWSLPELAEVGELAWVRVSQADSAVHEALQDLYGADGPLAFFMMNLNADRSMPLLENRVEAGFIAGAGKRLGFDLSRSRAEAYAAIGITDPQARAGFQRLDEIDRPGGVFTELVGETRDLRAEVEGADAIFGVGTGDEIARRLEQRQAAMAGGGGTTGGRRGSGLGAADSVRR